MEFEEFGDQEGKDAEALQNRFEELLSNQGAGYFEEEEYEELILRFSELHDFEKAMEAAKFGLAQYPFSTQLMLRQAQLYGVSDQPGKAFQLLDTAEMFEPSNEEIFITRGTIYSHLQQSEKAIECFMKARNLAEDQEEIFILIALEYQNMKKSAEAVKYFRKALKINPNNDFALYEIAWSYDEAGQTAEAIRFFEEFIDVYPYSLTAWQNLGLARIRSGEFEEAIQAFDYALAIEDDFVPAIVYKAYSLAGLLRYDEAIEVYKSSFEIQEPDAETLYLIGECFEKMQNMAQAERYFRKAVAKDPDFSRAWIGLGVVAEHYERPLEGIHCIKKALDVEDKNPEYWYFLAGFQDEAGLGEEADLSYRQSLMLEPNLWESRLDYSDFLAQHGHLQEAIDLLAEGIQIDPGRTSLIYRYGALLLQAGRRKSGIEVLEQALAQDYDLHSELLEYEPLLEIDPELNRLIDRYRP